MTLFKRELEFYTIHRFQGNEIKDVWNMLWVHEMDYRT
jgi:hypothetical protein